MALRYTVYTIVKRERKDDSWLNVGVANKPRPLTKLAFLFRNSVPYWRPQLAVETGRFSWYKKACR
jgi:hypothetical protein